MGVFPPIPKHEPPVTEELRDRWLASAQMWLDKGSYLFEYALLLAEAAKNTPTRGTLYVGKPAAALVIGNQEYARESRTIIPAMLYAMAVEDWLKGIVILSQPEESRKVRQKIHELL